MKTIIQGAVKTIYIRRLLFDLAQADHNFVTGLAVQAADAGRDTDVQPLDFELKRSLRVAVVLSMLVLLSQCVEWERASPQQTSSIAHMSKGQNTP